MHVVIAYDIVSHRGRTALSRMLADLGERVQRSVFECELDADGIRRFEALAAEHVRDPADSILILPVCRRCGDGVRMLGTGGPIPAEGTPII